MSEIRNLLTNPTWEGRDLGHPIPDSPHACSVALPHWDHVVGYEEERPEIIQRMRCGYPRFFWNPTVEQLFRNGAEQTAVNPSQCLLFPSEASAHRCSCFISEKSGGTPSVHEASFGSLRLYVVTFTPSERTYAKQYWRYSGEIISSRLAAEALAPRSTTRKPGQDHQEAATFTTIKQRLAEQAGQSVNDVFLFPSGMAAVFAVHQMILELFPDRKSIQIEFPYVDVLHVQREFGPGVHFFQLATPEDYYRVTDCLDAESISSVFCEVASNPLLQSPNAEIISSAVQDRDIPLIYDDTIASSFNLDAFQVADLVTTSLTKYFSGASDVMGGSVILRSNSPFRDAFATFLNRFCENLLWKGDAEVLEKNSQDYPKRMEQINKNTESIFDYLATVPMVETLYYPKKTMRENYLQLARKNAGYGGLLSLVLKSPEQTSAPFYDNLEISKGPSLGTDFSLACPYTLLAHYNELNWAESCGVSRHLIRISIGLENPEDLIRRFERAFSAIQ